MKIMNKPISRIGFRLMALVFKVRDFFRPRIDLLKEAGIGSGFCVLDFGCGKDIFENDIYTYEGKQMCEDCIIKEGLYPLEPTGLRRDKISEKGQVLFILILFDHFTI